MKDIVVLYGDSLHGSSAIIGWGLGFEAHFLYKEEDGSHISLGIGYYISEYMVCLDI